MATKPRIGLVIGQLTPGGAERQLTLLAQHLLNTDFEPRVYCMSDRLEPFGTELRRLGVSLRNFVGPRPNRVRRLALALQADRIDLVHAWLYIGNSYAWLATMLSARRALITSARNCKKQGRFQTLANRLAFRRSHRVVVNSNEVARYVEKHYGAPAARLAVVYNGVDMDRFSPSTPASSEGQVILGIGRLVPQKDPHLFLEAARHLAPDWPSARFVFIGEGPLRGELERRIASVGLGDRVLLPGETGDVAARLQGATLFWLTSAWEGLPNVVLEAMACGVPVVATDVGGTREIIRSGCDGFAVAHRDVGAIVHYSWRLLADDELRRAFAVRARERARQFSTHHMVHSMTRLYAEALAEA